MMIVASTRTSKLHFVLFVHLWSRLGAENFHILNSHTCVIEFSRCFGLREGTEPIFPKRFGDVHVSHTTILFKKFSNLSHSDFVFLVQKSQLSWFFAIILWFFDVHIDSIDIDWFTIEFK